MKKSLLPLTGAMIAAVLLSGCTESVLAIHTIKEISDTQKPSGKYKVGNPYQIKGITYHPAEDPHYDKIGVASWYGPNFHGKKTANGEIFNQWAMTAAHKTLAMPTFARVTNLENGRSVVVRVNDRGPFAKERIIDMSRRSAQLLGFEKKGTARVRVQAVDEFGRFPGPSPARSRELAAAGVEPQQGSDNDRAQALASKPAQAAPQQQQAVIEIESGEITETVINAPPVEVRIEPAVAITPAAINNPWYVQAGAFSDFANANRVANQLKTIGPVDVSETVVDNRSYFRVRLGPLAQEQAAMILWRQILNSGFPDARIVNGQ